MKDYASNWGATFPLTVTTDKPDPLTATITIGEWEQTPAITKTVSFSGLSADLTLSDSDMKVRPKTYRYQVEITYQDGTVDIFPTPSDCHCPKIEADLPCFTVVQTLDTPPYS